ncbi:MAG TPA: KH domain-containing protein [Candidatus Saccharimonadales bacterium]|nr:KH domain-containing protein [Candidatus Saccharimonadales bacterium]
MKDTLEYIVKLIVDDEDSVKIEEKDEDGTLNLIVTVAKEDMGKIIGKEGKVIRSIRNIMKIKAMKHDIRINITLAEIPQE